MSQRISFASQKMLSFPKTWFCLLFPGDVLFLFLQPILCLPKDCVFVFLEALLSWVHCLSTKKNRALSISCLVYRMSLKCLSLDGLFLKFQGLAHSLEVIPSLLLHSMMNSDGRKGGGERQRMKRKQLEEDRLKQTSALANYMALKTPPI